MSGPNTADSYFGTIYLDNPTLKQKLRARAVLDPAGNSLKFEYSGDILQYQLEGGTVMQAAARKNISNFFSQRVKVESERMYYVSFKFADRQNNLTFQADGVLKAV
ncbi:MAG TPA: hypothetical protein VGE15_05355 [Sphingobacteriaceae bacterium]